MLQAAIERADQGSLAALTMRQLGPQLGVEAMALYHHFANKDDLIDGMVDLVFGEFHLPVTGADWRTEMRRRAVLAREVLSRHPWAIGLSESRANPGPASLRQHDAMLGTLRAAGFSLEVAGHAYSLLDSYVYGFAMTHLNLPFEAGAEVPDVARTMLAQFPAGAYPNLEAVVAAMRPGYDYGDEFEHGLDMVLDAIERELSEVTSARRPAEGGDGP